VLPADEVSALHYSTRHGEQQTHVLADRSVLHLNTDSAVTVRYSGKQRLLILDAGEASFEAAHESGRPFRVLAGAAEIVDLGTRFDVRLGARATLVTVVEGRVAVRPAAPQRDGGAAQFVPVAADQQLSVSDAPWPQTPVAADAQRATAWLHRQISFDREPLEEVAAEFNRYAAKPIEITSPALRSLQVSGVFTTDNPDAFIAFLRSLEGVRVDVTPTRIVVAQQ
jgi:transmembrane sensor